MAFIRVKKRIKGKNTYYFAYEVENRWMKRQKVTKQRVKKYLGRVFSLKSLNEPKYNNFIEYIGKSEDDFLEYTQRVRFEEMVLDLIEYTLIIHGFYEGEGRKKNRLIKEDIEYDLLKQRLYSSTTKKPIVLEMHEGYMCDLSIRQMLRFNPDRFDDPRKLGSEFAKTVLASGVLVIPDVFVELFEMLQKERWKNYQKETD